MITGTNLSGGFPRALLSSLPPPSTGDPRNLPLPLADELGVGDRFGVADSAPRSELRFLMGSLIPVRFTLFRLVELSNHARLPRFDGLFFPPVFFFVPGAAGRPTRGGSTSPPEPYRFD